MNHAAEATACKHDGASNEASLISRTFIFRSTRPSGAGRLRARREALTNAVTAWCSTQAKTSHSADATPSSRGSASWLWPVDLAIREQPRGLSNMSCGRVTYKLQVQPCPVLPDAAHRHQSQEHTP